MAIDWDNFDKEIDNIIEESSTKTDDDLSSKISSLTRMTDSEVIELFPKQDDVVKLVKLMKIVKSADNKNIKINKIVSNAEDFSGVILTLLRKFI